MQQQREERRRKKQTAYQERLKSKAACRQVRERLKEIRQERNLAKATREVLDALQHEDRLQQRAQQAASQAGKSAVKQKRRQESALHRAVRQKRTARDSAGPST